MQSLPCTVAGNKFMSSGGMVCVTHQQPAGALTLHWLACWQKGQDWLFDLIGFGIRAMTFVKQGSKPKHLLA